MDSRAEQVLLSHGRARWWSPSPGEEPPRMMTTQDPYAGPPPPPHAPMPPLPPARPSWGRSAVLFAAALALAIAGVVGYTMGKRNDSVAQQPTGVNASSGSSSPAIDTTSQRIANKLDDSIVNITTRLSSGGAAAGTGFVISSDGLALTNNHVIADTALLRVEI